MIQRFAVKRAYNISVKEFVPQGSVERVIIGVHGFCGDKESNIFDRLADGLENTAVIAFDLPCHGESEVGEDFLTVENCVRDLVFMASFARERYDGAKLSVFGTSFGGFVALLGADMLGDCRLVLRAPGVSMPDIILSTVLKIDKEVFKAQGTVLCGFERKVNLPYSFYEELVALPEMKSKSFTAPILIFQGDEDRIVPMDDVTEFVKEHQGIRLEIIRGAGHRFERENEKRRIVSITKEFLS